MIRRGLLSSLVASAFLIAPLLGQPADLARVWAEYSEVEATRVAVAIERAVSDGLPRELLVHKAVEGVAKHMTPDVVVAAIEKLARELQIAARVVGLDADPEILDRAADAIQHGIDRQLLAQLRRDNPDEFAMMVVAIEDLIHVGVEPSVAEDMLRDAASNGLNNDEVLSLPASVRRLVREGNTPRQAARSVRASLRSGRSPFRRPTH